MNGAFSFKVSIIKHLKVLLAITYNFVQDNHSSSIKGGLREFHYQLPPDAQVKLVRCVVGEVLDVGVDIRRSSATFGNWVGVKLSAENKRKLWIPEGFAQVFLTLSDRYRMPL